MKNNGSPEPIFKTDDLNQYFLAELPIHPAFVGDNVAQKTTQNTTQKTTQKLTCNQQAILEYLQNHPNASRKDISEAVSDISEDGVKYTPLQRPQCQNYKCNVKANQQGAFYAVYLFFLEGECKEEYQYR